MSLITETGTGGIDSESFASVEDALTYHANRGNYTWATITTLQQEQALRRATDYLGQAYRQKWKGCRLYVTQALDWPRIGVTLDDFNGAIQFDPTKVPVQVVQACCEMALRAAAGELAPDLDRETIHESVGGIAVDYRPGSTQHVRYRSIDLLLAPYCSTAGAQLVRA